MATEIQGRHWLFIKGRVSVTHLFIVIKGRSGEHPQNSWFYVDRPQERGRGSRGTYCAIEILNSLFRKIRVNEQEFEYQLYF